MNNPCNKCRKKPDCPERCFPKIDYKRALQKERRKKKRSERSD